MSVCEAPSRVPIMTNGTAASTRFWKVVGLKGLFILSYHLYLGYAVYYQIYEAKAEWQWCDGLGFVLICTFLTYLSLFYAYVAKSCLRKSKVFHSAIDKVAKMFQKKLVQILIYVTVILIIGSFLVIDTVNDRRRLISASGVLVLVGFCTLASSNIKKISWRQVTNYASFMPYISFFLCAGLD